MINRIEKKIISSLNKNDFTNFIYELWKLPDGTSDYQDTSDSLKLIGNDFFEHHIWKYLDNNSHIKFFEFQSYNFIVPYLQPIDLFTSICEESILDKSLIKNLKKINTRIVNNESKWQFWTDGNFCHPIIQFVTNYEGLEKDFYYNKLIPFFDNVINNMNISADTAVGSCDSFFDINSNNVLKAFNTFLEKYQKQISFSISGDGASVDFFYPEKYISNGLLQKKSNPYEPIYIEKNTNKSEIIKEFEFLIKSNSSENKLELFLKRYFKEIFGNHYDRIETQLWLKFPELDISGKNRRLDIFLRNSIERDWELFELKRVKHLTKTYRDIPTFTNEINNAIQQIRNYEKILSQEKVKQKFAKEGIDYFYPELRLVVGTKPDISIEQWRFLKATNENNLKIITFSDLIDSMKIRYQTNLNNAR